MSNEKWLRVERFQYKAMIKRDMLIKKIKKLNPYKNINKIDLRSSIEVLVNAIQRDEYLIKEEPKLMELLSIECPPYTMSELIAGNTYYEKDSADIFMNAIKALVIEAFAYDCAFDDIDIEKARQEV